MAYMNNWLGFSLSPSQPQDQSQISGECFDLTSDSTIPSLNLPPSFGMLDTFNRNNQTQDWNMKDISMNSEAHYKPTSELSMLMGSSCTAQHNLETHHPKLENFLGGHSYIDHQHKPIANSSSAYTDASAAPYMNPNPNCSLQLPGKAVAAAAEEETGTDIGGGGMNGNSTIGLSMIKNWLRSQSSSAHQPPPETSSTGALSLSMSTGTGSQSSSPLPPPAAMAVAVAVTGSAGESCSSDNKREKPDCAFDGQAGAVEAVPRKSIDTFGQRTSIYRGVTRHRWTGRYEAHLWDNSCRREGQTRKGRQVYLGGYDKEDKAARAYDLAALKYWGTTTTTNFPISNYEKELEEMKHMTRQEYVASLRRKSSGFSRGASIYRGVTRHHQHGRWQARIGRVAGNKDLYLGTFSTQEEAAEAYDIAAIKFRGLNAVTNFDMSRYDVKSILESSTLPIGGAAKRLKDAEQAEIAMDTQRTDEINISTSHLADGIGSYHGSWPTIALQQAQPFSMHYPYGQQRAWCKQEQDTDNTHNFQDFHHQLQLGNTHNFFQPSVLHNLPSIDSSSMEHSSDSNSVFYASGGADGSGASNGGYVMPASTVEGNCFRDNEAKHLGYENVFGSSDPYHTKSFCYLPQQSLGGNSTVKASLYDQGLTCTNWLPTAVPTLAPRTSNMAVCHGAATFTVWNDT